MIIDKIKIKYKISVKDKFNIKPITLVPNDSESYGIENYKYKTLSAAENVRIGAWRDMWWFDMKECESSFAFFYAQYGANYAWNYEYCMVEYNPNKTTVPPIVVSFLLQHYAKVYEIVSLDVAFDFLNVPVTSFYFDCDGNTDTMSYGKVSSLPTRYLRPKANDGRIKIYDKEKERHGKLDSAEYKGVTRVEITYHNVGFLIREVDKIWGFDSMNRLKEMLDDLNSVKYPGLFYNCDSSSCKDYIIYMLDTMLDDGRYDSVENVLAMFSSTPRTKYRQYIKSRRELLPIFNGNEIEYGFALSDEIKRVLIA